MKGRSFERARGREGAGEGWAAERESERKRQRVKQRSGCSLLSSGEGKGGVQRHGESKKEWEGMKEGVLINMASGRSVIPLVLSPTLYHFLHQVPTH